MSEHTPGPWRYEPNVQHVTTIGSRHNVKTPHEMHIADIRGHGYLTGTGGGCALDADTAEAIQDANGRLIAAAPELLAACEAAYDAFLRGGWIHGDGSRQGTAMTVLFSAISKAKGNP